MEHNQPRGDVAEIRSEQHAQQVVPTEAPLQRPPVTFAEADAHNPFSLLIELHDHALSRTGEEPATFHLTELALSAAVVAWWSRWQPISMHRAFLAGASLADVAAAVGATETEAYAGWSAWANRQSALVVAGRAGVDAMEVDRHPSPTRQRSAAGRLLSGSVRRNGHEAWTASVHEARGSVPGGHRRVSNLCTLAEAVHPVEHVQHPEGVLFGATRAARIACRPRYRRSRSFEPGSRASLSIGRTFRQVFDHFFSQKTPTGGESNLAT